MMMGIKVKRTATTVKTKTEENWFNVFITVTAQFIQNTRGRFSVEEVGFPQYYLLMIVTLLLPSVITTSLSQMAALFSGVRFGPAVACVRGKSASLIG